MTFLGKQKHFGQLTQPWRDRLYGVALRQSSTQHMAEDWVQETLLRAWKDFAQLSEGIAIYAWLLKILDHVIADDRRKEKRRYQLAPIVTVDDEALLSYPCSSPGPFENMLQQQESKQLNESIESLPDEFRRVVLLRDIEGLSYSEVSYILDIPKGTVMSRLSRGRRILASALIKYEIKSDTKFGRNSIKKTKPTSDSGAS